MVEKVITKKTDLIWLPSTYILLCLCCINFYTANSQVEVPLTKRSELTLKGDFKFVSNTILGKISHDNGSEIFDPNKSYNKG